MSESGRHCMALVCLLVVAHTAAAQERSVPTLNVARLSAGNRPTIDGRVDDDVWRMAAPFTTFVQQEPNEGAPASAPTEIRFLLKDRHGRVAALSALGSAITAAIPQRQLSL